ncbi:MAG: DNA primase [Hadesarchaea archaeon]|nr:MAG: DNA primase [Hadesarchaea archaeon]
MREDVGTTKYLIHARIEANGVVERPDVVGAIFGQTEGLLGEDLDLRELLKTGRIGRINVNIDSSHGKSSGTITIPSSLDRIETSIIGAALETIDRVGPCEAKIKVEKIEDVRSEKRKFVIERAKALLERFGETAPETQEITERVKESVRLEDIGEYKGLPAGPGVQSSDAIVVVEGRADVLNLLRAGIKNVIAVEGTNVPPAVVELCKNKTVTAFLDSDRGGDLILKELLQVANVDFVARPPPGRSVEDLTRKEIIKALRDKIPVEQAIERSKYRKPQTAEKNQIEYLREHLNKLRGTLRAHLLDERLEVIKETQVRELRDILSKVNGVKAVVFDGVVTQELANLAAEKGIKFLVGMRSRLESTPKNLQILTFDQMGKSRYGR